MAVSNLSTYKFGKAKPEAGAQPPCVRAQEGDGTTQDLLWLFQRDLPNFPAPPSSERNVAWWENPLLCPLVLCVTPALHLLPANPLSSATALISSWWELCCTTTSASGHECLHWHKPCLEHFGFLEPLALLPALAGGSQPGRSCPCLLLSRDPAQGLQCCSPARPSGFASSTATPLCWSLCPFPNSSWLLEAPLLSSLCSTAPLAPGRQTPARPSHTEHPQTSRWALPPRFPPSSSPPSSCPRCFFSKYPHKKSSKCSCPSVCPHSLPTTKPSPHPAPMLMSPVMARAAWGMSPLPEPPKNLTSRPEKAKPAWLMFTQPEQWQTAACLGQAPTAKPEQIQTRFCWVSVNSFFQTLIGWPNLRLVFLLLLFFKLFSTWSNRRYNPEKKANHSSSNPFY